MSMYSYAPKFPSDYLDEWKALTKNYQNKNLIESWRDKVIDIMINDDLSKPITFNFNYPVENMKNNLDLLYIFPQHPKLIYIGDSYSHHLKCKLEFISEVYIPESTVCKIPFHLFDKNISSLSFILSLGGFINNCGRWRNPWALIRGRKKRKREYPEVYIGHTLSHNFSFLYTLNQKEKMIYLDPTDLLYPFNYYVKV